MVALEQLIIPLFSFILFIIFIQKWRSSIVSQKNVPPSPRKLPIIGNLHQLGTSPHRSLRSLSKRYGHLILLHFGRVPMLVASSAEAASEIMKNQDAIFSNRPRLSIPGRLIGSKDIGLAPYGKYWRQVRSVCVHQLLSYNKVQSFRHVREEETSAMVEKIRRLGSSSQVLNLSVVLVTLTIDVISRVTLGRKYSEHGEDKKFKKTLREFMELLVAKSVRDYVPWLGWIDRVRGLDAKVDMVAKQMDEVMDYVIQEHRDGKLKHDDGDGELDFVDTLLEFQRESKSSSAPVEDDTVKALILDMFAAGTDTVTTSLEWAIAELIKNPRAMKVLQNEIKQVVGNKKEIDEDDLEKMPYLKAVIKESLRLHPPVPLILRHVSTHNTKVMGYDITAGTHVFINVWAISRNPTLWEEPEEFRPERFLDSSVDFRGVHFDLIPFGSGRRGCPGIGFAAAVNELCLAKLVHGFNFALPNGEREKDLDMSETYGLTLHKKLPLFVVTVGNG